METVAGSHARLQTFGNLDWVDSTLLGACVLPPYAVSSMANALATQTREAAMVPCRMMTELI